MEEHASVTIWASWEIFAFFRGMYEWALVVGTIREMPTSHLFFAWILFTNLLLKIDSFLSVFGSRLVTGLILIFWSACIKSLHSFLPGILSAETQIFVRFLSSRLLNNSIKFFEIVIGFYNPFFYANLMGGFLPLLVLNYGFEVHIKIMRVLVDSLLWQNLLIFPTNSLQNIWFSLLLILVITLLLFWVCFNVTLLLEWNLFYLWFGCSNWRCLPELRCYFVDYLIRKFFGDLLVINGGHHLCENFISGLILLNS